MILNIFYIFLISLYVISASFWGLLALPFPSKDGMLLISLIVIIFYSKEYSKIWLSEDKQFYGLFLYVVIVSIVMAYLNFGQPPLYSIRATRMFIMYAALMISLNIMLKNFEIKRAHLFMLVISFLIIFINLYVYATGNTDMLVDGVGVLKRLGEIRVIIGTFTSIIFVFYFYYALKEHTWMIVPLFGLLFTMIVIAKTRSVVFPVLIILMIPLFRVYKAKIFKFWLLFIGMVLVSFIVTGYEKSLLSPIVNLVNLLLNESQSVKSSNVHIRGIEVAYFWSFLDIKSIIFGYGMDNIQYKDMYNHHFFLSDIGLFKVVYLHGMIGLLLYIGMFWKLYKVSKFSENALHMTGRSIVYFQILSPSSIFLYSPEYMFLLFVVYVLIKNENKKAQISAKE